MTAPLSNTTSSQPPPGIFFLDGTRFVDTPLSKTWLKGQFVLGLTIANLFRHFPVYNVLFVTLTFGSHIRSTKTAQRRLNSLLNKVRDRYSDGYLWVLQPQASGRIHYPLLIPVSFDTHDGTYLAAWEKRSLCTDDQRCASMSPALLAENVWWTAKASGHGFGLFEVAPVYSPF